MRKQKILEIMKKITEWLSPILMLLFGCYLITHTHLENKKYERVQEEGIQIVSQPLTEYTEYTNKKGYKAYIVDVTYQTKQGEIFTKPNVHVNESTINKANNETPILNVRYLVDEPEFAAIEGSKAESDNEIFKMLGVMLILGSIIYALMTAFSSWRRKQKNKTSA